jgi:drug/metabolite transporter (DMT)-like permease
VGPAFVRRERFPKGRDLYVGVASGVALGAHFGFWISSLDHTSVVLVSTQPVFVANLAYLLFGERTSPLSFAGILAALAGTAVIAGDDSVGLAALLENALALAGAVYSGAALSLLPVALILDVKLWGYPGETWFWLWAITLGPQIMVFNWALRYVEASILSGTILAEKPGLPTIFGGAVVLLGLFLLLRGRRLPTEPIA